MSLTFTQNSMTIKTTLALLFITLIFSCSTTHRVITDEGKVYEVKGNKFYNNGENITQQLTSDEKKMITATLDDRLVAEKEIKQRKDQLADEQKRLEKAQREIRRNKKDLEKEQSRLADKIKEKEDARKNFLNATDKLQKNKERFQELQEKGKLSPNQIKKWEDRIKNLEEDLEAAKNKLNNLK